jgi:sec-independent protein translocase protein TatC
MAGPLIILYGFSILIVKAVNPAQDEEEEDEEEEESIDNENKIEKPQAQDKLEESK